VFDQRTFQVRDDEIRLLEFGQQVMEETPGIAILEVRAIAFNGAEVRTDKEGGHAYLQRFKASFKWRKSRRRGDLIRKHLFNSFKGSWSYRPYCAEGLKRSSGPTRHRSYRCFYNPRFVERKDSPIVAPEWTRSAVDSNTGQLLQTIFGHHYFIVKFRLAEPGPGAVTQAMAAELHP